MNFIRYRSINIAIPAVLTVSLLCSISMCRAQSQTGGGIQGKLQGKLQSQLTFPSLLSVEQAVQICLERNPAAAAARAGAESALASYRSLASLPSPSLGVSYANGSSTSPTISGTNTDTFIEISESLDTSGQRRYQAASAHAQYLSAWFTFGETQLTLEQQTKDAYWGLAAARALLTYNHQTVQEAEKIYNLVKAQQAVGQSPRIDVVRSGIDVANAKQADLAAIGAEKEALSALNTLLGRAPELPITLQIDIAAAPVSSAVSAFNPKSLAARALARRSAVLAASQLEKAAAYTVKQNRAANMPDFSVDYQRSVIQAVDALVLSIHMPLVDFGANRYQVRSAEASRKQAAAQLKGIQQQVAQQVNDAVVAYQQARDQLNGYAADILKPSITLREMAQAGYREGATGILPVIDAETTLRSARTGYINCLLALKKAEDALNAAVGESVVK